MQKVKRIVGISSRLKAEVSASVVKCKEHRKTYDYDEVGQPKSITETGYSPTGEVLTRQVRYGYTKDGKLSWEDGSLPNGKTNTSKDSDVTVYDYDPVQEMWQVGNTVCALLYGC